MGEGTDKRGAMNEIEALSARWDTISFQVQGSPFEDLRVKELAKNVGTRPWSRPGTKTKGDILSRYIYFSFEELLEVEKLDLKSAKLLLEICEALFLMEEAYSGMGSFEEVDNQAKQQRQRFVDAFGLNQDFPIALSNLDEDLRELCASEEIMTFVDLMEFLDRLADKATIGGCYRDLQNVFAHGDEKGLSRYFPYRLDYRGFHLPETLCFMLKRLPADELEGVLAYVQARSKRKLFGGAQVEPPAVVEADLLPKVCECLCYFASHQTDLLTRLQDEADLARELMHLNDQRIEGALHWLVQLTLGLFRPDQFADAGVLEEEIRKIRLPRAHESVKELDRLLHPEKGQCDAPGADTD
ncbi:MAG: hypothetical protein ACLFU4_04410 [Opitutales bacterium]